MNDLYRITTLSEPERCRCGGVEPQPGDWRACVSCDESICPVCVAEIAADGLDATKCRTCAETANEQAHERENELTHGGGR